MRRKSPEGSRPPPCGAVPGGLWPGRSGHLRPCLAPGRMAPHPTEMGRAVSPARPAPAEPFWGLYLCCGTQSEQQRWHQCGVPIRHFVGSHRLTLANATPKAPLASHLHPTAPGGHQSMAVATPRNTGPAFGPAPTLRVPWPPGGCPTPPTKKLAQEPRAQRVPSSSQWSSIKLKIASGNSV